MWHKRTLNTAVDFIEYGLIKKQLLTGVERNIDEQLDEPYQTGTMYFVKRNNRHYIFSATISLTHVYNERRYSVDFKITSDDRAVVEEEMRRVRTAVDNITRVRKQQLERKAEAI